MFVRGKQSDDGLKLSMDRKTSPQGWWQPSRRRWVPQVPNSFGLPAGTSCPGRTGFCQSCYGVASERSPGVQDLVSHNLRLLQTAATVESMASLLDEMVGRYVDEAARLEVPDPQRIFRIHWDGDYFSTDYAEAWAQVIGQHPDVRFWAYTRSFRPPVDVVPILAGIPNLTLYLSVDEHNHSEAMAHTRAYPMLRLAFCATDYSDGRALSTEGSKPLVCPENSGKMPLMTAGRGACVDCGVCVDGTHDVLFSTTHREVRAAPPVTITIGEPRSERRQRQPQPAPKVAISIRLEGELADAIKCLAFMHGESRTKLLSKVVERWLRLEIARDKKLRRLITARVEGRAAGWKDRPRMDDLLGPAAPPERVKRHLKVVGQ